MPNHSITSTAAAGPLPADDPARALTVVHPDDPGARHISLVGDTYTILVSGAETDGRYTLIDMLIPADGGPPPHRHDFEEMFTLLEGELEFTFRGQIQTVSAPATVNIPANAPHSFKNVSGRTVHMLCMCCPAGQEEFFKAVGTTVESRSSPAPKLDESEMAATGKLVQELAPKYRTEMVGHP